MTDGHRVLILTIVLLLMPMTAAAVPSGWSHFQTVQVRDTGLVQVSLPPATLDVLQPDRADLRVVAPDGRRIAYDLRSPRPADYAFHEVGSFDVDRSDTRTWIQMVTNLERPIDAVRLGVDSSRFFKTVTVMGGREPDSWSVLVENAPIFASPNGPRHTLIEIPKDTWPYLALEMDHRQSAPLSVENLAVGVPAGDAVATYDLTVDILRRRQKNDRTVLDLQLPARHLPIRQLTFSVRDPVFRRDARLSVVETVRGDTRVRELARGTLFKLEGGEVAQRSRLTLPVRKQINHHRLRLTVQDGDNPPLTIRGVKAAVSRVNLLFLAERKGTYRILSGNPVAETPDYDLTWVRDEIRADSLTEHEPEDLQANPAYRTPERLPEIPTEGAELNPVDWRYRKTVRVRSPGIQWLELEPDVLAHARSDLRDLRLVRNGRQIPYVPGELSLERELAADSVSVNRMDVDGDVTRWSIELPYEGLPISSLSARVEENLFERNVTLYEERSDHPGGQRRRVLARHTWKQVPDRPKKRVWIPLRNRPRTRSLALEIQRGDNAPLSLSEWSLAYRTKRLFFKSDRAGTVALVYGNQEASRPDYDIEMVASELMTARGEQARTGKEQAVGHGGWWSWEGETKGVRWLFWGVLALAVAGMVFVIARLLPEPPRDGDEATGS